ncbi:unnamed protein product [Adineta ricciae]|uniref:Uncharacterized protein n=1 Tax=Adineta ricciae TaxID=249248 RepID=A0A815FQP5_ADIRI|nr:unnamed protein product [Adineta ricciae]CAF1327053.1 unnamed protein product [Adineta ricciae]
MGNNPSTTTSSSRSVRISNLTAVTNSDGSSISNKEDVTLIWLDKTIDASRTTLREITNFVVLYTELDPCIAYIRSITTERIFLIVSGSFAGQCLEQIHDLEQVDSIFIFCMNLTKYKTEFIDNKQYSKLVDVFDKEDQLLRSIREELNDLRKQLATYSLYENQKTTRDLSSESASFLWFQIFKDVLLQMPKTEQSKNEMIEQCKRFYRGNNEELQLIKEFEQKYTESDTIYWYTKQCFIYRLCNKALRTEDIELLYIFRYYIQDLCKRLAVEYESYRIEREKEPIVKLYRGLKLTKDELTRFQANIGSLISTNGFLSTSRNYDLALQFAVKKSKRAVDVSPTLFIIEADTRIPHAIFADISSLSVYPDEEEVLFDIDCAFKITEVYFDDENSVWIVKMKLTDEARQVVETYIEANRREMEKGNIFLIFGLLLTEMGQYDEAQYYFESLLASNTVDDKISLYTNIGRVKYLKGLFSNALKDFKVVYDLQCREKPRNEIDFARTMNNLAMIYMEQKKYDLAFDYLFDAIKIYKRYPDVDKLLVAKTDNVIGVIYTYKHDYDNALKYLFRAMKFYEQNLLTIDHPLMATNYNSIGLVYYHRKDYQQAMEYCLKSLRIREKILPVNHSDIGDSSNNLALVYQKNQEYKQALDLFKRSLDIYSKHPEKKMNIPVCYGNIALLFIDEQKYDQAIEYHLKALECYQENDADKYHEEISDVLDNLGTTYETKGDVEQALKYYKQTLQYPKKFVQMSFKIGNIYQKQGNYKRALDSYLKGLDKSENCTDDLLARLLMSIGLVFHQQNDYEHALDYYKRTLSIFKHSQPSNELELAWLYNNLGCLYTDLDDLHRALKYQEKAYHIRSKSLLSTHPDIATSLTNLGRIYQKLAHNSQHNDHEVQQAYEYYQAALKIRQESLSVDHPDIAVSHYNLAVIHIDRQDYKHAYEEIRQALDIQKKIYPENHPQLEQTLKVERQITMMLDYCRN